MMSTLRTHVVAPAVIGLALILQQSPAIADEQSQCMGRAESSLTPSIDYEAIKASYYQHVKHVEELKAEIYLCLASIEWNQDLWDLISQEELPHRAFAQALFRFGDEFESAFADHSNLVVRDRRGRLRLTPDALSAWAYVQAEQILSA